MYGNFTCPVNRECNPMSDQPELNIFINVRLQLHKNIRDQQ
ncbi:hypothetical protein AM1_5272 [Acaryochloris marina MBIC11017]|uniref:Uncharacterized protein n=1 Tax=Acaryochloris marina (strain MBIC 11017) TaxID=329726 RepID=B0C9T5_ACAM1|nr:hypothetical protein AM1_5272 [Acaryochloris marina MBIC11017]